MLLLLGKLHWCENYQEQLKWKKKQNNQQNYYYSPGNCSYVNSFNLYRRTMKCVFYFCLTSWHPQDWIHLVQNISCITYMCIKYNLDLGFIIKFVLYLIYEWLSINIYFRIWWEIPDHMQNYKTTGSFISVCNMDLLGGLIF